MRCHGQGYRGWVVFNTCMQMHSGYVRLELAQSIALDGARAPRCQAGTFQLLPLMVIFVSLFELDRVVFVAVTFTAWVSLDPSTTLLAFWTSHRSGQASSDHRWPARTGTLLQLISQSLRHTLSCTFGSPGAGAPRLQDCFILSAKDGCYMAVELRIAQALTCGSKLTFLDPGNCEDGGGHLLAVS